MNLLHANTTPDMRKLCSRNPLLRSDIHEDCLLSLRHPRRNRFFDSFSDRSSGPTFVFFLSLAGSRFYALAWGFFFFQFFRERVLEVRLVLDDYRL
ncbi:hypothetical protein BDZ91DRAFT_737634, partial [Kalaharituber pfeilii]